MFFVEDMSKLTNMHSHKQQAEDQFLNSVYFSRNKQNTIWLFYYFTE